MTAAIVEDQSPGVSLLVRPPDEPPVHAHVGKARLEHNVAIDRTTTFNIGSAGKQITAYLIVQAAREGRLALDQPARHFLPRLQIPGLTVADLVVHHGGVRDAETLLSLAGFRELDHYTADDLLGLAYRQTKRAVPPGRFLYSNTGYLLLAQILRAVHGTGLDELARTLLFSPLGMPSAHFKADPREVVPGAAASYRPTGNGWEHCETPVALPGPGSLWCNVDDLDRWLGFLQQEWNEPRQESLPFGKEISYRASDHQPHLYGPGLYADPRPARGTVFHHGHEQGFSASTHLTYEGLHVVCLSNHAEIAADHIAAGALAALRGDPNQDIARFLTQVVDARQKAAVPAGPSDPHDREAAQHTSLGAYICDQVPGRLQLSRHNGDLYLWRRGTRDRLTRTGPTTYTAAGYILTLDSESNEPPRSFILDLERAPALHYESVRS
ncbi:penicillin-binding protein, beta-lactamase class C [Frankia sp. CcI6]|uniref:serine hydrolase domain-containing protein n=1 Tax=unclassified Frankia TaxID=2632575 RepID=UPI0003CFDC4C|nr:MULTISPECIES: serine hydrolase domain-containing protein [unclassified Frankia]ETA00584.1 penicillin-binding protein, beta-lactamase class C [Frankia sp. CcI6]